jgi:hypothetical protein
VKGSSVAKNATPAAEGKDVMIKVIMNLINREIERE